MKTVIFTCLCFVFSQIAMSQIECISLVTLAEPEIGQTIELFPKDFLTDPNAVGDFTMSIDEGQDKTSFIVPRGGVLIYFITITDNNSGSRCSTVLSVLDENDSETNFPLANCKPDIVLIQDEKNSLSIEDVNDGSFDEITPTSDLIFSISKNDETSVELKPGDDGFKTTEELFYTTDEICEIQRVNLFVWDTDGFLSICRSTVFISATTADCQFAQSTCENNSEFAINQNGYLLSPYDFVFDAGSYEISIDDGPYFTIIPLSLNDLGQHSYRIRDENVEFICQGNFEVILQTGNQPPTAICEGLVTVNLDITNRITVDDVDAGSNDEETRKGELIRSLSTEGRAELNPSDDGFMAADFLEFSANQVCESVTVLLQIWDEENLTNSCWSTVQITDNLSLCDFNSNPLSCNTNQTFYVDDNQNVTIDPGFFSFELGQNETLLISVSNGPFKESIEFTLEDLGTYEYTVSNIDGSRQCSGTFDIEEICTTDPCPNVFSFDSKVATQGESICVSALGISEFSIASIQTGITWDPNVLEFVGLIETGTLEGITYNDANADQGELRFVWLMDFSESALEGDFGFDICFDVIGSSGEKSEIKFQNLGNLNFEITAGELFTFPMILESGQVCVDTCPDENGNTCYSFDQGQCATDEFADQIDINASAEDMASQMRGFLESKSLEIGEIKVVRDYHEAACEACGICPEPHRFYVQLSSTQHKEFEALDLLNTESISCDFFDRPDIQSGEIPLFINASNVKVENSVIQFTLNNQPTTQYNNGTYGMRQADILSGTNELSIERSTGSIINGVSTLDIVMLLKHILGLESLAPHQLIAGDIDKSGDVSLTKDIIKMTNLILGIDVEIDGSNWFFIPEDKVFDPAFDGFNFTNDFDRYQFLDTDINSSVGIAVDVYKYGDLNQNFALNRTDGSGTIQFENLDLIKDEEYEIEFTLQSDNIDQFVGAQASIVFDDVLIQGFSHDYGTALNYVIDNNIVKFSFASGEEFEQVSFTVQIKSNTQNQLEKLLSINENFATEFITAELNVFDINLSSFENTTPTEEFSIPKMKIYPNPVLDEVNIIVPNHVIGEFLNIYNTQGQLEYSTIIDKAEMNFNATELNSKGLKFIRINNIPSQKILIH